MRTKTLLLTAAFGAAGVATSLAQGGAVYSVNAVGYVNKTLRGSGLTLVSNPLDAANNTIPALFAGVPAGTQVYKFSPTAGYSSWTFAGGPIGWSGTPAATTVEVNPGEGVFVRLPNASTDHVVTFVGEVPQGTLSQDVPTGLSLQASQVPQAGGIVSVLAFPVAAGDQILRYVNGQFEGKTFAGGPIGWSPAGEPSIGVGESFFVRKIAGSTWTRTFNVNDQ